MISKPLTQQITAIENNEGKKEEEYFELYVKQNKIEKAIQDICLPIIKKRQERKDHVVTTTTV